MKKIINGKMYNTETATEIGHISKDCGKVFSTLYRKKTGEFFFFHETYNWGTRIYINPCSESTAKQFVEDYLDAETYIELWGEPDE